MIGDAVRKRVFRTLNLSKWTGCRIGFFSPYGWNNHVIRSVWLLQAHFPSIFFDLLPDPGAIALYTDEGKGGGQRACKESVPDRHTLPPGNQVRQLAGKFPRRHRDEAQVAGDGGPRVRPERQGNRGTFLLLN